VLPLSDIAAPIGHTALFCIRTTWQWNRLAGFAIGVGAALAQVAWTILACAGFTAVYSFVTHSYLPLVELVTAIILIIIGISHMRYLFNNNGLPPCSQDAGTLSQLARVSFCLTIWDPLTALGIISIFSHLDFEKLLLFTPYPMAALLIGVFIGGLIWWTMLVTATSRYNNYLHVYHAYYFNFIIGLILLCIGICFLIPPLQHYWPFLHQHLIEMVS
jgi:threonine/homoserine/homoserine lactone efflux protein